MCEARSRHGTDKNTFGLGQKIAEVQNAECGIENPKSEFQNPKLQINKSGELEVETELGTVKFHKTRGLSGNKRQTSGR